MKYSRNGGLELELSGMSQANVDLGLLQENNLTNGVYARESVGFCVVASDDQRRNCGGVSIFYKESQQFVVESHQQNGQNFVIFQLVTGGLHYHLVGCYLAPRYASTLESVVAAIGQRPRGTDLLVVGDFNKYLELPDGHELKKVISTAIRQRVWKTRRKNSSPSIYRGLGMSVCEACSVIAMRCGPRRTT